MRVRDFAKIYFTLVLLHLAAVDVGESIMLIRFTKPLLLASLLVFYLSQTPNRKPSEKLLSASLFFSLIGDILLMFQNENMNWFIAGLASFLVAHVFFSIACFKELAGQKGFLQKNKVFAIFTTAIVVAFYFFLQPLPEMFNIPIALYAIAIVVAWNCSINRLSVVSERSFWLVLMGMSLFFFSDSLIAVNTFKEPFPYGDIVILATYFSGQFLIVWGMLYKRLED